MSSIPPIIIANSSNQMCQLFPLQDVKTLPVLHNSPNTKGLIETSKCAINWCSTFTNKYSASHSSTWKHILKDDVGINIFESDAHDEYPDCVFIEDTAVVISNDTVVSRIGAKLRQEEVDAVKDTEN